MIVTLEDLPRIRLQTSARIVLATGTFDLFHYEHLIYLEGAKKQGDVLVVAVKNNKCAKLKKTCRPIVDEVQRIAIVDALKCVDFTILVDYNENQLWSGYSEEQRQWLCMFEPIIDWLSPDVLYYEDNPKLQEARNKLLSIYGVEGCLKKGEKEYQHLN